MMNWLRTFMTGRNGVDQLNIAVILLAVALNLIAGFTGMDLFTLLATIALVWAIYRMFSRNLNKRRAENDRFTGLWSSMKAGYSAWLTRKRQSREYRFFTCPGCKNKLRVPRGKGKLQITCPRCGQRFGGKT
jgi:ribosomal protein S27E